MLISPLDWGLGHASRCVPLIADLLEEGCEVIIAGEGYSVELLKKEFPGIRTVHLDGYRVNFHDALPLGMALAIQLPKLFYRIWREHAALKRLVKELNIDLVISDNRYGFYNRDVYSVFITHQTNAIAPSPFTKMSWVLNSLIAASARRFNELWIPDFEGVNNLSGQLSHKSTIHKNTIYIGPLSRFESCPDTYADEYDIVALVSGPEPQRSIFEKKLIKGLIKLQARALLLRGISSGCNIKHVSKFLTVVDHLPATELCAVLKKKPIVICRGGYSTLMDLWYTGNKIICMPTPGQTEQEYLATTYAARGAVVIADENDELDNNLLKKAHHTTGLTGEAGEVIHKQVIKWVIEKVKTRYN